MLDDDAKHAALRGAPEAAAPLEEQVTRLTAVSRSDAARERTVRAADYHFRIGDMARGQELIQYVLPACPAARCAAAPAAGHEIYGPDPGFGCLDMQTHIGHILQKLGARSSTELAAQLVSAWPSVTPAARPFTRPDPPALNGMPGFLRYAFFFGNITDSGDSAACVRN
jgi:hypothetical protein